MLEKKHSRKQRGCGAAHTDPHKGGPENKPWPMSVAFSSFMFAKPRKELAPLSLVCVTVLPMKMTSAES